MAQWMGQFSGLTHRSKLADAEVTLRTAVAAFRAAPLAKAEGKAKAVRRLAARVLNLRLKLLRARRNAQVPVRDATAERLRTPEQATEAASIREILAEFEAADAEPGAAVDGEA